MKSKLRVKIQILHKDEERISDSMNDISAVIGESFLRTNKGTYELVLDNHETGLPQFYLYRIERGSKHRLFSLDMTAIYEQCAPMNIIKHSIADIQDKLHIAEYALDNHGYESREKAYEQYHKATSEAIFEHTKRIDEIIKDAQNATLDENLPF